MILLYWIILPVLLAQRSTARITCDDQPYERPPTSEEYKNCLQTSFFGSDCDSPISDILYTTCHTLSLESNDHLYIRAQNPKVLLFNYSFIETIPSRLFEKYSSLQKVYIDDSYVTEIDFNAFAGLTNLEELYLQNNGITKLEKGIFNSLINLRIVDISNNQIGIIENKSFHGLTHLAILDLSHNVILNVSDEIFDSNLHSLTVLNVSHNFISTIELPKILALFSHVEQNLQIDLSYNALKFFNFSQIAFNLETLSLNNNNLETLGVLNKSIVIKYLDVSNNRLSKFNYPPENIIYLNLSGNLLQNFNTSFSKRSTIETLDLGRNLIRILKSNTFDNMSSLTNLCLKDNQLGDLPIGLFKNLKHLLILNLSGNHFKRFEFGIFSGLSDLLVFDISNNSLSDLNFKTYSSFKNLTVLNIANNDLVTLNPYDILNHCEKLELVILNDNPWNCVSLLNFIMILNKNSVTVMEGSNMDIKNHQGHACHDHMLTENSDKRIGATDRSIKNEINDLTKFFEFDFRNSSFYHYFENYKNGSPSNLDVFNEYFNKDFKNTSFYKYFNKNISVNFSTAYDESFHNLTNILSSLNLKLANLSQPNLTVALSNSSHIDFEKFSQVLSNFSNYFDQKFSGKDFTNLNALSKSSVDLLNGNLEKFSKSVNDMTNFVEKESFFYKLLQTKLKNGSSDIVFSNKIFPKFPEALTSNTSYAKVSGVSDINENVAQQVASLRGNFVAFMTILITLLLIAMLIPVLKKFACSFVKNPNAHINTSESIAEFPLV